MRERRQGWPHWACSDVRLAAARGRTSPAADEGTWDQEADILVVGAGGAGLTAAVVAARGGANVVVLEAAAMAGGNTVNSSGVIQAAGTGRAEDACRGNRRHAGEACRILLAVRRGPA